MHDALASLGFNVRILLARVVNNQNIDTPRTHRVTLLEFNDEQYLVDVGFGAMCPKAPLKINSEYSDKQTYRIIPSKDNNYTLELLTKRGYFSLYEFNLSHYTPSDCMMGNFYSAHHPNAVFVNNFVVSLIRPDITLSLRNNAYHRISENTTEIIGIPEAKQLHSILTKDFNIPMDEEECARLFGITKRLHPVAK